MENAVRLEDLKGFRKELGNVRLSLYQISVFIVAGLVCIFGISGKIGALTIRPERMLVVLWLLFSLFLPSHLPSEKGREQVIRESIFPLMAWTVWGLLSSFVAIRPDLAVRHWIDLTLAVMFFFVVLIWGKPERLIRTRPTALMGLAFLLGSGGLLAFVAWLFVPKNEHPFWGFLIGPDVGYFRVRMTMLEPNLYGALMMVFALLSLAEWQRRKPLSWLIVFSAHAGLFLALSRGPFVGYMIGLGVYFGVRGLRKQSLTCFSLLGIFFMGVLARIWYVSSTGMAEGVLSRFNSLETRSLFLKLSVGDIWQAPFLGNGTYSFSFLHPEAPALVGASGNAWLPSLPVTLLHDTGLIGLLILMLFFFLLLYKSYRSVRKASFRFAFSPPVRRAASWLASAMALLVSSLVTPAYSLSFFWGVMAVVSSIPYALQSSKLFLLNEPEQR